MISKKSIAILVGILLLAGCALSPTWVMKGSGAFPGDREARIYGVGIGQSHNLQMRKDMADNRARQELADTLKTTVQRLVKDYMKEHKDYFNMEAAGADEFVTIVSKSVTDAVLVGSQIIDRWEDEKSGALYALAVMDLNSSFYDQYKEKMKKAIREQHRAVIKTRVKEAEADLDKEIEKQRKREKEILGY